MRFMAVVKKANKVGFIRHSEKILNFSTYKLFRPQCILLTANTPYPTVGNKNMQRQIEGILSKAFDIPFIQFEYGMVDSDLLEHYCFYLIKMVRDENDPTRFEHLKSEAQGYTDDFVNYKIESCPDKKALEDVVFKVNVMSTQLGDNRQIVLSDIFWVAHKQLLIRDFGAMYGSLSSECQGITKEAEEFQEKHQS